MTTTDNISEINEKAIKTFFCVYGKDTLKVFTDFIFSRLTEFTSTTLEKDWTDQYLNDTLLQFTMLKDLILSMKPPTTLEK